MGTGCEILSSKQSKYNVAIYSLCIGNYSKRKSFNDKKSVGIESSVYFLLVVCMYVAVSENCLGHGKTRHSYFE